MSIPNLSLVSKGRLTQHGGEEERWPLKARANSCTSKKKAMYFRLPSGESVFCVSLEDAQGTPKSILNQTFSAKEGWQGALSEYSGIWRMLGQSIGIGRWQGHSGEKATTEGFSKSTVFGNKYVI